MLHLACWEIRALHLHQANECVMASPVCKLVYDVTWQLVATFGASANFIGKELVTLFLLSEVVLIMLVCVQGLIFLICSVLISYLRL